MRFATSTFLWSSLPFAVLLTGSFWATQKVTLSSVRGELRSSVRKMEVSMARLSSKWKLQNDRVLRVVGDNAPLKAGMQLMRSEPQNPEARGTVDDQLRQMCSDLGFDFLLASGQEGEALAGVIRQGKSYVPLELKATHMPRSGFFVNGSDIYQVTSIALDQGDENVGLLTVGELFDIAEAGEAAALIRNGRVLRANIPGVSLSDLESALRGCVPGAECQVVMRGQTFEAMPAQSGALEGGYSLLRVQNMDASTAPVQAMLRGIFLIAAVGALGVCLAVGLITSRSIVKPLTTVIAQLRESEKTGVLPEFPAKLASIQEIQALTDSFNRAATVVRQSEENLHRAYLEFVGALASALDARDPYTSGHSYRVSEHSCAIARALALPPHAIDEIRVGALLHDIGKIGIADGVLQKPGKLTQEEYALIREHPTIGRRILEGVRGFEEYLAIVELHHENWDGTGYPQGLRAEAVPLGARIVHVADAYDAMTSDRPYRLGMAHDQALRILRQCAGTQFDPAIVEAFCASLENVTRSLQNLCDAVQPASPRTMLEKEAV